MTPHAYSRWISGSVRVYTSKEHLVSSLVRKTVSGGLFAEHTFGHDKCPPKAIFKFNYDILRISFDYSIHLTFAIFRKQICWEMRLSRREIKINLTHTTKLVWLQFTWKTYVSSVRQITWKFDPYGFGSAINLQLMICCVHIKYLFYRIFINLFRCFTIHEESKAKKTILRLVNGIQANLHWTLERAASIDENVT